MPRPARRLLSAIVLALTIGAAGVAVSPQAALAAAPDVPVAISPEEGAFVAPGPVVLSWTAVAAPAGYEVTWSTDAGAAGTASSPTTSTTIEADGGSFSWQVRALPDGAWSEPATFHADVELPTLADQGQEQPAVAPATPLPGLDAIPGSVWVAGALGFSAVFLAAVVIQSRVRREQDV